MYPRLLAKSEWLVACVLPRVCVFAALAPGDIEKQMRQCSVLQILDYRIPFSCKAAPVYCHLQVNWQLEEDHGRVNVIAYWARTAGRLCGCSAIVKAETGKVVVSRVFERQRQIARFSSCPHRPTE